MLIARDIMTTDVVTIGPDATVREAAALMMEKGVGALPVLKDGRLAGILSHNDYTLREPIRPVSGIYTMMRQLLSPEHMESMLEELAGRPVSEVMASDVSTAEEETPVWRIAQRMARERIRHMPILNGHEIVGIVAMQDFLKAILRQPAEG